MPALYSAGLRGVSSTSRQQTLNKHIGESVTGRATAPKGVTRDTSRGCLLRASDIWSGPGDKERCIKERVEKQCRHVPETVRRQGLFLAFRLRVGEKPLALASPLQAALSAREGGSAASAEQLFERKDRQSSLHQRCSFMRPGASRACGRSCFSSSTRKRRGGTAHNLCVSHSPPAPTQVHWCLPSLANTRNLGSGERK